MKRKAAGGLTVLLICMILSALAFGGRGDGSRQAALRQSGAPGKDATVFSIASGEPVADPEREEAPSAAAFAEEPSGAVMTGDAQTLTTEPMPAAAPAETDDTDAPASSPKPQTPEATVNAAASPEPAPAAPQTSRLNAPTAPGSGQETVLVPNFYYHGALDMTGGANYVFTLTERGAVQYELSVPESATSSGDWEARLWQKYTVNGVSGETAYRLLNVLTVDNVRFEGRSPRVGVLPGDYLIEVVSGANYSAAGYDLIMQFTATAGYEIECNDTPSRYTSLYPDVAIRGSGSNYGAAGSDVDWYLVRLYASTAVELRFSHETRDLTTVPFVVTLYDADGAILFNGRSSFQQAVLASGTLGLTAGDYLIKVEARVRSELDYTLLVSRSLSGAYEQEPNDTPETATPLPEGVQTRGAVSDKAGLDRDYYRLTLDAPGAVTLTLENPGMVETDDHAVRRVTLMDGKGRRIWSAVMQNWDDILTSPAVGLAAGSYYVCVDDENLYHAEGEYVLSYQFTSDRYREREYNNSRDFANEIDPNTTLTGTLTNVGTVFDEDWFRFTVTETRPTLIRLSHPAGERTDTLYEIEVLDAHGVLLLAGSSPENAPSLTLRQTFAPGVYFVKISAGTRSTDAPYMLFVGEDTP